jgi:hypothetical protein
MNHYRYLQIAQKSLENTLSKSHFLYINYILNVITVSQKMILRKQGSMQTLHIRQETVL